MDQYTRRINVVLGPGFIQTGNRNCSPPTENRLQAHLYWTARRRIDRDRRIAPTEADIRMMAFSFREFTNLLNKGKRLPEIAKPEAPLDVVSFLRQLPVWGL